MIETEISRITATKKGQKGQEKPLLSESDEKIATRIKKKPKPNPKEGDKAAKRTKRINAGQ